MAREKPTVKHVPCEQCPAWRKLETQDGEPVLLPRRGQDGNPAATPDGSPVYLKGPDGRFVTKGNCAADLPQMAVNPATMVAHTMFWPETPSTFWCESERKHELMMQYRVGPYEVDTMTGSDAGPLRRIKP